MTAIRFPYRRPRQGLARPLVSETRLPRFHALCRLLHATILECPPPTSWDEFNEVRRGATSPTVGALWMPRSSLSGGSGDVSAAGQSADFTANFQLLLG